MDSLRLPEGEVHLWYDVVEDRPVEIFPRAGVPSPEESERCFELPADKGRRECLAAYSMLRNVLSQYAPGVLPAEWHFDTDARGRQMVARPAGNGDLRFNLSFADGIAACVIASHYDVGVEVGRVGRQPSRNAASSMLSTTEAADLGLVGTADRPRRLLEYWALREAFTKARGISRPVAPHALSFDISRPGRPRVTFGPGLDDDEAAWQFDRLFVGTEHVGALATRRGFAPAIAVVVRAFESTGTRDDA